MSACLHSRYERMRAGMGLPPFITFKTRLRNTSSLSLLKSSAKRCAATSTSLGLLSAIHAPSASLPALSVSVGSRRAYTIHLQQRLNDAPPLVNEVGIR